MADITEFGKLGGKHCDDMGPGGTCRFCGPDTLHGPAVIVKTCIQCGDPAELPGDDYCAKWPSCVNTYTGWSRRGLPRMGPTA